MGKYLIYGKGLASIIAIKVLQKGSHSISGLIDPTGELRQYPLCKKFRIFSTLEIPTKRLKEFDTILIGIDTEPQATKTKKKIVGKFPGKKVVTILERKYLPVFLALREEALKKLVRNQPKVVPINYGARNVLIYADTRTEHWRADKTLEEKVINYLMEIRTSPMVFYDIGANIGLYSLLLAQEDPFCQIHAFEPEPYNFQRLISNIQLNGFQNITSHLCAIGAKKQLGYLYLKGQISGHGKHSLINPANKPYTPTVVWDLDSFLAKKKTPPPDLIKIDVEGYEIEVLKGMDELITTKQPTLIIEVHNKRINKEQFYQFLKKHRYSVKILDHYKTRDFICAHPADLE